MQEQMRFVEISTAFAAEAWYTGSEKEDSGMEYFVNENCVACGLCTSVCPEVFSMGDEGTAVAQEGPVSDEFAESAAEAMDSCPVSAIERK